MNDPSRQSPHEGVLDIEMVKFDRNHPGGQRRQDVVISESPLNIQVDGTPYTLLRTPGNDRELVVGFLFTEGLIATVDDIILLSECPDLPDVITVKTAAPEGKARRTMMITSSCGLCGREDIEGLLESMPQIQSDRRISLEQIYKVPGMVRQLQTLFRSTGGAHASALIDPEFRIPCIREDVGRHNAMDKLIGNSIMQRLSMHDMAVFLSGRTSIEMIIKVARARIPILLAVGAPTGSAVKTADRLGITLCGFLRDDSISVYCHERRIVCP